MKRLSPLAFFALLAASSGVAATSPESLNSFRPKVLPVLVQVNAQGRVTDASPSIELSPRINRLLMANLGEMISKPATDRHGRPISSQFIINLALEASPRAEGDYEARFAYVSSKPVPSGSWYWVHIDGHRLALADRNSIHRIEHFRYDNYRPAYRPTYNQNFRPPQPPVQNASRMPAPATAPVRGR
jgi:hypothetical protein